MMTVGNTQVYAMMCCAVVLGLQAGSAQADSVAASDRLEGADVPAHAAMATNAPAARPADGANDRIIVAEASVVSADTLAGIQGGADMGRSLAVNFAIERVITLDGKIEASASFKWSNQSSLPSISISTPQLRAGTAGLSAAGATNILLLGAANNILPTAIIQNSANDRNIGVSTVLSVSANSFSTVLSNRVLSAINQGLTRGAR
ncbi:hypothetical protein [Jeongeupia sp. HS-3]|uniref:hypothetical protein n=1 Tax=Jeongeupia sp. HS-3 TaxID=1009682 RepID=UPI00191083A0|nr:hypothetical protein [Jeongeupia sp. HS-3]